MEEESKVRNDQTGSREESHSFANKLIKNDKSDIQSDHQVSQLFPYSVTHANLYPSF